MDRNKDKDYPDDITYHTEHLGCHLKVQQLFKKKYATFFSGQASENNIMIEKKSYFPQLYIRDELRTLLSGDETTYRYMHNNNIKFLGEKKHSLLKEHVEIINLEIQFFVYILGYIQGRFPRINEVYFPVTGPELKNVIEQSTRKLGENFSFSHEHTGSSIYILRKYNTEN